MKKLRVLNGPNYKVLVVAPHREETGTGKIARRIAKRLGCPAIINDQIKRSELDANNYTQSKKHEHYHNMLRVWAELEHKERPLAIWLHGHGLKKGPMCVVGYGQPDSKIANSETVQSLMVGLNDFDVEIMEAQNGFKKYAARSENNMAQFFKREGFDVDSIQLELSKLVRGMFADDFARALSKSIIAITKPPQDLVPVNSTQLKPIRLPLVEEAADQILKICHKHIKNAMLEVGQYFIRELFNGEIERARNPRNSIGDDSFNQICEQVQAQGGPSKRWLYNTLKFVINEHDYGGFAGYAALPLSHKVELFRLDKDPEAKKKLILKDFDHRFSIEELRHRIKDESMGKESYQYKPPTPQQREVKLVRQIANLEQILIQKRAELEIVRRSMEK